MHVQHSLAISSELAQALSDHGITSVQINAEELVRASLCRDWATATSDVVVAGHIPEPTAWWRLTHPDQLG